MGVLLLAVSALAWTGVAGAQPADAGPPIDVEDVEIEDRVVPLDEPGKTEVQVRVGCDAAETPGWSTLANLSTPSVPDWATVLVSPSSLTWSTQPGDCPSQGTPYQGTVNVIVALDQDAPAYEDSGIRLEATVDKAPPEGPTRTYGPASGTVAFTPGYFHLHNLRVDEKIQEGDPGDTLVYESVIENFSNHETLFSAGVLQAPESVDVALEPETLTLTPNATGSFEIRVSMADPTARLTDEVASVHVGLEASSTGPTRGVQGGSQLAIQAQFQAGPPDPRDAPSIPAGLVVGALTVLAGLRRRP